MDMMTSLWIFLGALVLLFLLRRTLGLFWSCTIFFVASVTYIVVGFDPPVPASVVVMYVAVILTAMLMYVTSSEENRKAFLAPFVSVITKRGLWPLRFVLLLVIPGIVAWVTYQGALPSETAPPKIRSAHPSPPNAMDVLAAGMAEPAKFDIIKGDSPYRALEVSDPETFKEKLALGKAVYYQNCYYCHGDYMAADGHYADAVKPPPANFQDPGTIAMLEEAFIYWRVAKGGPGLPNAGTPWDSTMPAWEKMLTEDEMWAVILFMYEYTGYRPRTKENLGAH